MKHIKNLYRGLGVIAWTGAGVAAASGLWISGRPGEASSNVSLVRYLAGPVEKTLALDPTGSLRHGDPVFYQSSDGRWSQIGFVAETLFDETGSHSVTLSWYANDVRPGECELRQHYNRGRLEDIVRMLLPEEKRARIQDRIAAALKTHGDEISRAMMPLVEQSVRDSLPLVEAELHNSLTRHRSDVNAVAARLNRDVIEGRLIPLAKEQMLPIVRRHAQEPMEKIGRELWNRASIWRFGWRAVYDSTPLPKRQLVKEEWQRFVDEEAIEVIEDHMDELTVAVQRILADVASDPDIRLELSEAAETVAADVNTRALLKTILQESLVANVALKNRWREIWTSPQATSALAIAGERLEPVVRSIGDDIFGTRDGGIDPEFARLLRNQILGKDKRWIVARRNPGSENRVIAVADEPMSFPIVYLAQPIDETAP